MLLRKPSSALLVEGERSATKSAQAGDIDPLGILITFLMLFPVYWMVANSLETTTEMFRNPVSVIPTRLHFSHT